REAVPGRRRARPLSPTPTGSGRRTRGTGIATAPTRISLTGNSSTVTPPTPTPRAGSVPIVPMRSAPTESRTGTSRMGIRGTGPSREAPTATQRPEVIHRLRTTSVGHIHRLLVRLRMGRARVDVAPPHLKDAVHRATRVTEGRR